MDLKDLTPKQDTVEVILKHPVSLEPVTKPNGDPMKITMFAPTSKEYREVMYERADARLDEAQKSGTTKLTAKEMDNSSIDMLARITKSWDIHYDGKEPKLSVAKAASVYDELRWIKPQLEDALDKFEAFT